MVASRHEEMTNVHTVQLCAAGFASDEAHVQQEKNKTESPTQQWRNGQCWGVFFRLVYSSHFCFPVIHTNKSVKSVSLIKASKPNCEQHHYNPLCFQSECFLKRYLNDVASEETPLLDVKVNVAGLRLSKTPLAKSPSVPSLECRVQIPSYQIDTFFKTLQEPGTPRDPPRLETWEGNIRV